MSRKGSKVSQIYLLPTYLPTSIADAEWSHQLGELLFQVPSIFWGKCLYLPLTWGNSFAFHSLSLFFFLSGRKGVPRVGEREESTSRILSYPSSLFWLLDRKEREKTRKRLLDGGCTNADGTPSNNKALSPLCERSLWSAKRARHKGRTMRKKKKEKEEEEKKKMVIIIKKNCICV